MERTTELKIPRTLEEICDPSRLALIVYDMQVGIIGQLRNATETIDRVLEVIAAAREAGVRIFFTRHLSLPTHMMGVFQLRQAMAWQRIERVEDIKSWFLRGTPAFELIPQMAVQPDEVIFDKITMSAFEGTPLNIALRDCGIQAFAIVGIALEIGIEPTVRHATDLGYIPVVVADACGGRDEAAMNRALEGFAFAGDTITTDTETFTHLLRDNRRGHQG